MEPKKLKSLLMGIEALSLIDLAPPISAVLVTLCHDPKTGNLRFLLTKRTETVHTHKGQVSFPGGFPEKQDKNLLETALREAEEEVGIRAGDVEVLGMLEPVYTRRDVRIFPFVGLVNEPYEFRPNPSEVDRIIYLPFNEFLETGIQPVHVEVEAFKIASTGIRVEGELVWGATARMLEQIEEVIKLPQSS